MTTAVDLILSEQEGLNLNEIFKGTSFKFSEGLAIIISKSSFVSMVESFILLNS